jgi:2-keto-4-pentenoate hydratase/2-oxohepta-3-ene-1,7-dioic acid hydratase in catechol pathway
LDKLNGQVLWVNQFDNNSVFNGNYKIKIDSFTSLENINFELTNNGKSVQKGNTSQMLWKIDELIAYVSQYFTLKKGDIIFTGTPEGVAKVSEKDVLEGFINDKKLFSLHIK